MPVFLMTVDGRVNLRAEIVLPWKVVNNCAKSLLTMTLDATAATLGSPQFASRRKQQTQLRCALMREMNFWELHGMFCLKDSKLARPWQLQVLM